MEPLSYSGTVFVKATRGGASCGPQQGSWNRKTGHDGEGTPVIKPDVFRRLSNSRLTTVQMRALGRKRLSAWEHRSLIQALRARAQQIETPPMPSELSEIQRHHATPRTVILVDPSRGLRLADFIREVVGPSSGPMVGVHVSRAMQENIQRAELESGSAALAGARPLRTTANDLHAFNEGNLHYLVADVNMFNGSQTSTHPLPEFLDCQRLLIVTPPDSWPQLQRMYRSVVLACQPSSSAIELIVAF